MAESERWGKVIVHRPDLFPFCPFSRFEDGFYFKHPTHGVLYDEPGTPTGVSEARRKLRRRVEDRLRKGTARELYKVARVLGLVPRDPEIEVLDDPL
ncbi:MAG: hypothetical protein ACTSSA_11920 [Candidatus Freyarchaeota archaeon]